MSLNQARFLIYVTFNYIFIYTEIFIFTGDLAEVVVYQGKFVDKLIIGPTGVWNDSLIPRNYHLPNSIGTAWEMTAAEVLGGIDGTCLKII